MALELAGARREVRSAAGKRRLFAWLSACVLTLGLLVLLPVPREGLYTLLNRLFAASEQVNAYAYERLPVPDGTDIRPAALLLVQAGVCALGLAWESRAAALGLAFALVAGQVYFGLSFPPLLQIALAALAGFLLIRRAVPRAAWLSSLAAAGAAFCLCLFLFPGTDPATEAFSERVRDLAGEMAASMRQDAAEEAAGEKEVRHVHPRRLEEGGGEGTEGEGFRLVTRLVREVSRPQTYDLGRAVLMLGLSVLLLLGPFVPFAVLERRRRLTRARRAAFDSPNRREAAQAMFLHAMAYLEGEDMGSLPYALWPRALCGRFPESYLRSMAEAAGVFEEARYSGHAISPGAEETVRGFLEETEKRFFDAAPRREKLRLRYGRCLHE